MRPTDRAPEDLRFFNQPQECWGLNERQRKREKNGHYREVNDKKKLKCSTKSFIFQSFKIQW